MKKNKSIKALLVVLATIVLTSCGGSRHRCPAYGSVDVDQNQIDVAELN